jgi:Protein of unknown function (DUF3800)
MEEQLSNEEIMPPIDEKAIEKEKKIAIQRQQVLNDAVSGRIDDDRGKVAFLLNNSIEARNSDKELVWLYWKTFDKEVFNGVSITEEVFKSLTPPASIIRQRAKIQNEYKLFEPNDKVKRQRGVLEEEKKNQVIEDKPVRYPFYTVYMDETGKNQPYLSIGSLWLNDPSETMFSSFKLKEWIKQRNVESEFHFKELKGHKLELYKAFFLEFLTLFPSAGFKVIVINRSGLPNNAITDLTFHLLNDGIKHENESGRAPLPRELQVYLDNEELGSDQLKIANIKERLATQKVEGLKVGHIEAIDSEGNIYLQVVDLFIASVNRIINTPDGSSHKDELANYILNLLNFDIKAIDKGAIAIDKSVVFNLAFKKD